MLIVLSDSLGLRYAAGADSFSSNQSSPKSWSYEEWNTVTTVVYNHPGTGYQANYADQRTCSLVLGVTTIEVGGAGALACGVILGSGGGVLAGEYFSDKGEGFGEMIYNSVGK